MTVKGNEKWLCTIIALWNILIFASGLARSREVDAYLENVNLVWRRIRMHRLTTGDGGNCAECNVIETTQKIIINYLSSARDTGSTNAIAQIIIFIHFFAVQIMDRKLGRSVHYCNSLLVFAAPYLCPMHWARFTLVANIWRNFDQWTRVAVLNSEFWNVVADFDRHKTWMHLNHNAWCLLRACGFVRMKFWKIWYFSVWAKSVIDIRVFFSLFLLQNCSIERHLCSKVKNRK